MKHMKEVKVKVPTTTKTVVDNVTCDLCGQVIDGSKSYNDYSFDEVKIERRVGVNYPEGGSADHIEVDMCGKCFEEKFIPWLKSQGFTPEVEEVDW